MPVEVELRQGGDIDPVRITGRDFFQQGRVQPMDPFQDDDLVRL